MKTGDWGMGRRMTYIHALRHDASADFVNLCQELNGGAGPKTGKKSIFSLSKIVFVNCGNELVSCFSFSSL